MSLLELHDVHVDFRSRKGLGWWGMESRLRAVDGVELSLDQGTSLGIVGESGCGKSTLARAIVGLVPTSSGEITFDGTALSARRTNDERRRIQMVFQDPASSLNPQMTIGRMLVELLEFHGIAHGGAARAEAAQLVELVQLPTSILSHYPRKLSGGQRQRVGIARALAVQPDVIIADEPAAALDVSVQAAILNLFNDLRRQLGLSLIFISHDLGVVRHVSDRVAVVYLGRVVEEGDRQTIFEEPKHPYTQALIQAVPTLTGGLPAGGASPLRGEPPSPLNRPSGCAFRHRCAIATERCAVVDPMLQQVAGRRVACHNVVTA